MRSPSDSVRVGFLTEVPQLEQVDELAHRLLELRARHVVDGAIELEGLARGQVPEELLLLPESRA
jgi:hypothetical protein